MNMWAVVNLRDKLALLTFNSTNLIYTNYPGNIYYYTFPLPSMIN